MRKFLKYILIFAGLAFVMPSCEDEDDTIYSPKPRGYFRIDFPKKEYRLFDSICPYSFQIPVYARIAQDKHRNAEPCWLNVEFPKYKAIIHLSYKAVRNDLDTFLTDSRNFAIRHQIKATGLDETVVIRDSARVYGLVYDIAGNTASSVQFYLTDSTRHFLRGALYFDAVPNIDSLKIVVDFIREDILQIIKTTKWKDSAIPKKEKKSN